MNMEFTTINNIASEIYSHPLMKDLPFDKIVSDTLELMQITGSPNLFETKEEILELHKWRAILPCNYYQINQLVTEDGHRTFLESTGTFCPTGQEAGPDNRQHYNGSPDGVYGVSGYNNASKLVYIIRGRLLYTSMKEGKVKISYEAIKLDKDGFPMIINNASYLRALKSYIKMNWFTIKFEEGKIKGDVLQNAQQEYYGNIAQAQNSLIMPDEAQMQNIAIIMNDALERTHHFYTNYKDLNTEMALRIH